MTQAETFYFNGNLIPTYDCNITADGEICFANTLAPDGCLYAIDVKSGNDLWSVKDVHMRAGRIELDEMKKVIEIERVGLGVIKTVDFRGHPVGELEEVRRILTSATGTSKSIIEIASILDSPNRAFVLEGLEKLKSLLRNRKISIYRPAEESVGVDAFEPYLGFCGTLGRLVKLPP